MRDTALRSSEQLGMAIRLKRQEKKLSQAELARLVGVERKWILKLEAGNSKAEIGAILRTLEVLGIRGSLSDSKARSTPLAEILNRLQKPPAAKR